MGSPPFRCSRACLINGLRPPRSGGVLLLKPSTALVCGRGTVRWGPPGHSGSCSPGRLGGILHDGRCARSVPLPKGGEMVPLQRAFSGFGCCEMGGDHPVCPRLPLDKFSSILVRLVGDGTPQVRDALRAHRRTGLPL